MLKIKNSSTDKFIEFDNTQPITIYNCGPTVYNDIHIGNARPLIVFDVLYRFLLHNNYQVKYIQNLTDIDDKIINRALELKQDELVLSNHYAEEYLKLFDALNVKKMNFMPKVSDNIDGIINMIRDILKSDHAYVNNENVYFKTNSIKDYGSVSRQNINNLIKGARIDVDPNKKDPLDFALWKKTDKGINWKTEWNNHGRPGWHSECVYLINKFIGKQVDIHGGGVDLKFPHHENENAQNLAWNNLPLAKCWMHVGHLNIKGEKMSKSLGNFIIVNDIIKQYDGNALRWFLISSHYEKPINYTDDALINCTNEINHIFSNLNLGFISLFNLSNYIDLNDTKAELPKDFSNALNDNLNTPNAIKSLWDYVKNLSNVIRNKSVDELKNKLKTILLMLDILGIKYINPLENKEILELVNNWNTALKNKDYKKADEYREILKNKKII